MNKIPCNTIRDLLVLYEDDACSEESRNLIEEHIAECEECRKIYNRTKEPLPDIKDTSDDQWEMIAQAFHKWKKEGYFRQLLIVGIVLLVLGLSYALLTGPLGERLLTVPTEDIRITKLYELENGNIYCELETAKPFCTSSISEIITPSEYREKDYDEGSQEVRLKYPLPLEAQLSDTVMLKKISILFSLESMQPLDSSSEDKYVTHRASSIYLAGGSKEDRLLLWKKGQTLEPAPQELEERIEQELNDRYEDAEVSEPWESPSTEIFWPEFDFNE